MLSSPEDSRNKNFTYEVCGANDVSKVRKWPFAIWSLILISVEMTLSVVHVSLKVKPEKKRLQYWLIFMQYVSVSHFSSTLSVKHENPINQKEQSTQINHKIIKIAIRTKILQRKILLLFLNKLNTSFYTSWFKHWLYRAHWESGLCQNPTIVIIFEFCAQISTKSSSFMIVASFSCEFHTIGCLGFYFNFVQSIICSNTKQSI